MSISIVIVDDHPVIRHGLKNILAKQDDFLVTGQADNGISALEVITAVQPDVVILDITMEGIDGISLIAHIKKDSSETKIIIYTTYDSKNYICRALQAGARGYVLKSEKITEVSLAIYSVQKNKLHLSPSLPPTILAELITADGFSKRSPATTLTPREYEIASLIAQGQDPNQVANTLFISPKTVRVHRTKIMHKLSCKNIHELLLQLRQHFPQ
ncbi:MAG: DNA-binding NarL/FixJ family response regulator [Desulforhopalus sp.]|jgi:DNA-binding NarL/FixJ family response regulator